MTNVQPPPLTAEEEKLFVQWQAKEQTWLKKQRAEKAAKLKAERVKLLEGREQRDQRIHTLVQSIIRLRAQERERLNELTDLVNDNREVQKQWQKITWVQRSKMRQAARLGGQRLKEKLGENYREYYRAMGKKAIEKYGKEYFLANLRKGTEAQKKRREDRMKREQEIAKP